MKKRNDYYYITFMKKKKDERKWRARIQFNGKREIKYFKTKEDAEAYRKSLINKRNKVYKKGGVEYYSLRTLANYFFESKKGVWTEGTIANYRCSFENVFSDYLNNWFHELQKDHSRKLLNEGNLSRTFKGFYAFYILDSMDKFSKDKFNYSLDWSVGVLRKEIKISKGVRKKPREYHDDEEIKKISSFLRNCDDPKFKDTECLYHIYRLGLSLGCRGSELCSLKKNNYDKGSKSILINSTISVGSSGWIDSNLTKTKTSRVNSLSQSGVESLEWLMERSDTEYIIPNFTKSNSYKFVNIINLSDRYKSVLEHLGIIWIGTHGMFRKTFATLMAQKSNKSHRDMIASIQNQLGHKSPQMTLHYIQAINTDLSDELSELDAVLLEG